MFAISDREWRWRRRARCRHADPDLFFHPDGERARARKVRIQRARQVCVGCGVIRECAAYALDAREGFGIWGGVSEDDRIRQLLSQGETPRGRAVRPARFTAD